MEHWGFVPLTITLMIGEAAGQDAAPLLLAMNRCRASALVTWPDVQLITELKAKGASKRHPSAG
jgi:hypothetical protein